MMWRQSTYCTGGHCVEVAIDAADVLVRDSKEHGGPDLRFTTEEWSAFVAGAKSGEFDPPGGTP